MNITTTKLINHLTQMYGVARVSSIVNSVVLFRSDPSYNSAVVAALHSHFRTI